MEIFGFTLSHSALSCILFVVVFLWMIIVTILLEANRRADVEYRKMNDKEHHIYMKNVNALLQMIRKMENHAQNNENDLRKISSTVTDRLAPLMSKESVIKGLRIDIEQLEKKLENERRMSIELASQLNKAKKALKRLREKEKGEDQ